MALEVQADVQRCRICRYCMQICKQPESPDSPFMTSESDPFTSNTSSIQHPTSSVQASSTEYPALSAYPSRVRLCIPAASSTQPPVWGFQPSALSLQLQNGLGFYSHPLVPLSRLVHAIRAVCATSVVAHPRLLSCTLHASKQRCVARLSSRKLPQKTPPSGEITSYPPQPSLPQDTTEHPPDKPSQAYHHTVRTPHLHTRFPHYSNIALATTLSSSATTFFSRLYLSRRRAFSLSDKRACCVCMHGIARCHPLPFTLLTRKTPTAVSICLGVMF